MRSLIKHSELILGGGLALLFVLMALFAPALTVVYTEDGDGNLQADNPVFLRVGNHRLREPQPPSQVSPLGTTTGQLDVYNALVWGGRDALSFGLSTATIACLLGSLIGLLSGYMGGWVDWWCMRITDGFLTFPLIAGLVMAREVRYALWNVDPIEAAYGSVDIQLPLILEIVLSTQFVFILFMWMPYARLMRALALQVRSREFVEAARALGAGPGRIILRHMLPNTFAPMLVLLSRDIGMAVLLQAGLTFIGITDGSVWGEILAVGKDWVIGMGGNPFRYWWIFVPVSLVLILFGTGWSLLGDGLNNLFQPPKRDLLID